LPFFTNAARQVYSKATETIFNYIDAPSFKKFHTLSLFCIITDHLV